MATKPTRGVAVQMDKERHLRFPLSTLQEIEGDGPTFVRIIWLGLRHEDPKLTLEDVGEMVDLELLAELKEPLRKATGGLIDLDRFFTMAEVAATQAVAVAQTPPAEAAPEAGS